MSQSVEKKSTAGLSVSIPSNKKQKRTIRLKSGCLCCRKRKIRCDELKPDCNRCLRKEYKCVWPKENQSLSHKNTFKLVKLKRKKPISFIYTDFPNETNENNKINGNFENLHNSQACYENSKPLTYIPGDTGVVSESHNNNNNLNDIESHNVNSITNDMDTDFKDNKAYSYANNAIGIGDTFTIDEVGEIKTGDKDNGTDLSSLIYSNKEYMRKEIVEDGIFRKFLRQSALSLTSVCGYNTWIPGIELTTTQAYLYSAFINGFIVSISPQLAHHSLLPGSVFIPLGINNSIVRRLFFSCGASYICQASSNNFENEYWLDIAKGDDAIREIQQFIERNPIDGNIDWILTFLLLVNIKQKYIFEGMELQTMNLISSVAIIKLWKLNKTRNENNKTDVDTDTKKIETIDAVQDEDVIEFDNYSEDINSNIDFEDFFNFNMKTSNKSSFESSKKFYQLISKLKILIPQNTTNNVTNNEHCNQNRGNICSQIPKLDDLKTHYNMNLIDMFSPLHGVINGVKVEPYERTLLETFIFNYSGTLLITDHSLLPYMTSPFEIFDELAPFLSQPLYNCAVPWMNNPVVGAALPTIELEAKINWISLHRPLSSENRIMAMKIRKLAKYFLHPILPMDIYLNEPESIKRRLMESCYISDIIAKAVFVFATKLLWPDIKIDDEQIQNAVDSFNKNLKKISLHSQSSVIGKWAFIIIGSAMIKKEDKDYLAWRIENFGDALKTGSLRTVLIFLRACWGTETEPGPGWGALFDGKYLKLLVI